MHQNKGKLIADCLADRTDYAEEPDKTNDGELLSSYECDFVREVPPLKTIPLILIDNSRSKSVT